LDEAGNETVDNSRPADATDWSVRQLREGFARYWWIDKNFHQRFQPSLHQVTSSTLAWANTAFPHNFSQLHLNVNKMAGSVLLDLITRTDERLRHGGTTPISSARGRIAGQFVRNAQWYFEGR
jgi:hypothetical protein